MIAQAEKLARESAKNAAVAAIKIGDITEARKQYGVMLELKAKADAEAPADKPWAGLYARRVS